MAAHPGHSAQRPGTRQRRLQSRSRRLPIPEPQHPTVTRTRPPRATQQTSRPPRVAVTLSHVWSHGASQPLSVDHPDLATVPTADWLKIHPRVYQGPYPPYPHHIAPGTKLSATRSPVSVSRRTTYAPNPGRTQPRQHERVRPGVLRPRRSSTLNAPLPTRLTPRSSASRSLRTQLHAGAFLTSSPPSADPLIRASLTSPCGHTHPSIAVFSRLDAPRQPPPADSVFHPCFLPATPAFHPPQCSTQFSRQNRPLFSPSQRLFPGRFRPVKLPPLSPFFTPSRPPSFRPRRTPSNRLNRRDNFATALAS